MIEIVSVIVNSDGYGDGDSHDFVALRARCFLKSSRGFKPIRLKFQHWVLGMIQGAFKTKTGRGSWGDVIYQGGPELLNPKSENPQPQIRKPKS